MAESAVNDLTVVTNNRFPFLEIIPEISDDVPDDSSDETESLHDKIILMDNALTTTTTKQNFFSLRILAMMSLMSLMIVAPKISLYMSKLLINWIHLLKSIH